ncbi:MAG: sulfotransferase [Flavobacteriaceae bacterium]|nr:sulfotransferase [Flavobacteriaceae bacterium]
MSTEVSKNWISKEPEKLPDFIIGGAMKSGTSTLHAILDRHPDLYIPEEEIGFWDCDNISEHFDFSFYDKGRKEWIFQDMEKDPTAMWNWYHTKFAQGENFLKGEDSTSYLASAIAGKRIAAQQKKIKLVFLLRQPSRRCYSHYFHLLRAGIVSTTFEKTLEYNPNLLLKRSLYKEQLEAWYRYLPKEQIKVILFEDLVADSKKTVQEVCGFLGISTDKFSEEDYKIHANKAKLPLSFGLHRLKNRLFRSYGNSFYLSSLPFKAPKSYKNRMLLAKAVTRISKMVNPLVEKKTPSMRPTTKEFLDNYFKRELKGLDELTGLDAYSKWFK